MGPLNPILKYIRKPPTVEAHALKLHMAELGTHPLGFETEDQIEARPHNTPTDPPPKTHNRFVRS